MLRGSILVASCVMTFVLAVRAAAFAAEHSLNPASGNAPGASYAATGFDPFPMPAIAVSQMQSGPPQIPGTSVSKTNRANFERPPGMRNTLVEQWSQEKELPSELRPGGANPDASDARQTGMTVKEAIYIAIRNNPGLKADMLDPLAARETVRQANAAFDPALNSQIDQKKDSVPAVTNFSSVGLPTFSRKQYDLNLGVTKLLSTTNGTLSFNFDNSRIVSNARTWTVNPSYNPSLGMSLSQPLLRNFGLDFATINVRIAQASQAQAQYTFEQQLSDFVLRIATDYWNVVRAFENLQVNEGALKLAEDTLNQDLARLKMGMAAQIDVREAQSKVANWRAAVLATQNELATTNAILRQEVMLNGEHALLPERIEPSDQPSGVERLDVDEEGSLERAMENRPELGAMREAIRGQMLRARYAANQTLPQLNMSAQVAVDSTAGSVNCFHFHDVSLQNCTATSSDGSFVPGTRLPFGGTYGDALNRLGKASFYNYAMVLNLQVPISNDYPDATLARVRVESAQLRLRYRDQISKIIVEVQSALSNLTTTLERARATNAAAEYARTALSAEEARYRAGVANTHELLQYQQELISALAYRVQAQLDLEVAKLTLKHAEGTLLKSFQIDFIVDKNYETPWYARF